MNSIYSITFNETFQCRCDISMSPKRRLLNLTEVSIQQHFRNTSKALERI